MSNSKWQKKKKKKFRHQYFQSGFIVGNVSTASVNKGCKNPKLGVECEHSRVGNAAARFYYRLFKR